MGHHHLALLMLAMLLLLRELRLHMVEIEMLSALDIVELLDIFLPRRHLTLDAIVRNIERRHRKRREAIESAPRSAEKRRKAPEPSILTK